MAHPEQPPFPYHHLGVYESAHRRHGPRRPGHAALGNPFVWGCILYLLSGQMACILEEAHGESVVELQAGAACSVPQEVWHRLLVYESGDLLFLTPAEGTAHRPISSH